VSVLRDDKGRLVVDEGDRILMVAPVNGDMEIGTIDGLSGLAGAVVIHITRDDAVALRDWINAALTSGAIR